MHAAHLIGGLFDSDEKLLWWDKPPAWVFAIRQALDLGVSLAVLTVIFSVLWPFRSARPLFLFLLAFGAVAGLIAVSAAYNALRAILNSGNVVYALTNKRLIVAIGRWKVRSYGPKAFQKMQRWGSERGTIWFDFGHQVDGWGFRRALFCVQDAAGVERLIRQQFPN